MKINKWTLALASVGLVGLPGIVHTRLYVGAELAADLSGFSSNARWMGLLPQLLKQYPRRS